MAAYFTALKSPYPLQTLLLNNLEESNQKCPMTPSVVIDMEYISVYTDKSNGHSIVDPKAQKTYTAQTAKIKSYETQIYKWIESVLSGNRTNNHPIKCSVKWLSDWAQQNALLGHNISAQGEAVRKWTLATLSSQYIQIKDAKFIDKNQKHHIENWLSKLADQVMKDYAPNPKRASRNNNHQYWTAWSVMITGVTLNNRSYYQWGIKNYKKSIKKINHDGSLPLELDRQSKAFHYHVFAAAPLFMMAETAKKNKYNLYKYQNSKILKLADFILDNLESNQKNITLITGKEQDLTRSITGSQLAWLNIYDKRYPDNRAKKWIHQLQPMIQRRIGGNISRLFPIEED
jgi:poly(beta-D-mannuronate) lyase